MNIKQKLQKAKDLESNANILRKEAVAEVEKQLEEIKSKEDKIKFVNDIFKESKSGVEISIRYNFITKINKSALEKYF